MPRFSKRLIPAKHKVQIIAGIIIGVTVAVLGPALITVSSLAGSAGFRAFQLWRDTESRRFRVELGNKVSRDEYDNAFRKMTTYQCLIVRYGSDDYLTQMASEEERSFGYTQLKKVPASIDFENNNKAIFTFKIPVHKRLGTQFKCFVDFRGTDRDKEKMTLFLLQSNGVRDIKWTTPSQGNNRGWLVLEAPGLVCITETRNTACAKEAKAKRDRNIQEAKELGIQFQFTPTDFDPIENNYARYQ